MISKDQAIVIAHNHIEKINQNSYFDEEDNGVAFVEEFLTDHDGVFAFYYVSKKYLETQDEMDVLFGPGPVIIDKDTGELEEYGSGYSTEMAVGEYSRLKEEGKVVQKYFSGFTPAKNYKINISRLSRIPQLVNLLDELHLSYVKPEVESGTIWRIKKPYSRELIKERLEKPPVDFTMSGKQIIDFVSYSDRFNICEFTLEEIQIRKYESSVDKATEEDYEAIW